MNGYDTHNLKIGIDAGQTLVRLCSNYPNEYFVGVEIKPHQAEEARNRLRINGIQNAEIVNIEAQEYLQKLANQSIFDSVHIYFPTPYPKALVDMGFQIRDRLLTRSFFDLLHRILRIGGTVRILTDVEEYYNEVESRIDFSKWWPVEWVHIPCGQREHEFIGTPCERQYVELGREILPIQLIKI